MMRVRNAYAGKSCLYDGGYQEVRWDLSGCNLRCLFCWSPASRPSETGDRSYVVTAKEVVASTLRSFVDKSRAFVRFTGGEPTLQWSYLTEALLQLQSAIIPPKPPILFQTNGIEIGKGEVVLDVLRSDPNQHYLFELSFKGTNSDEFTLLTGKPAELYGEQIEGYRRLQELAKTSRNIRIVAVLGVYHSAIAGPSKYAFVNPCSGKLLFDDYQNWDSRFSELWRTAPLKWVEPLRMSPLGVWKNVLKRCGPSGAGVLRNFRDGTPTNVRRLFPAKPKSGDYARQIVTKQFWR